MCDTFATSFSFSAGVLSVLVPPFTALSWETEGLLYLPPDIENNPLSQIMAINARKQTAFRLPVFGSLDAENSFDLTLLVGNHTTCKAGPQSHVYE